MIRPTVKIRSYSPVAFPILDASRPFIFVRHRSHFHKNRLDFSLLLIFFIPSEIRPRIIYFRISR